MSARYTNRIPITLPYSLFGLRTYYIRTFYNNIVKYFRTAMVKL